MPATRALPHFVFAASFLLASAYGLMLLLAAHIVEHGGTENDAGRIISASGLVTLAAVVATHSAVRHVGAGSVAASGSLLYAGGAVLAGIGFQPWTTWLMVAASLLGAGWGAVFTVTPWLTVQATKGLPEKERTTALLWLSAFTTLGLTAMPTLGQWLLVRGGTFPQLFAMAALLALGASWLFWGFHGGKAPESVEIGSTQTWHSSRMAARALYQSEACFPVLMVFLGACVLGSLLTFQPTFASRYGLDFGTFYATLGAAMVMPRLLLARRLGRFSPTGVAAVTLLLMSLGVEILAQVPSFPGLYPVAATFIGLGYGLAYPHLQILLLRAVEAPIQMAALGAFSFSYFSGMAAGPRVAGLLIAEYGYPVTLRGLESLALLEAGVAGWRWTRMKAVRTACNRRPLEHPDSS